MDSHDELWVFRCLCVWWPCQVWGGQDKHFVKHLSGGCVFRFRNRLELRVVGRKPTVLFLSLSFVAFTSRVLTITITRDGWVWPSSPGRNRISQVSLLAGCPAPLCSSMLQSGGRIGVRRSLCRPCTYWEAAFTSLGGQPLNGLLNFSADLPVVLHDLFNRLFVPQLTPECLFPVWGF